MVWSVKSLPHAALCGILALSFMVSVAVAYSVLQLVDREQFLLYYVHEFLFKIISVTRTSNWRSAEIAIAWYHSDEV